MLERSLEHQAIEAKESRAVEERDQILEWLSVVKHEEKHHDVRVRRMNDTGDWLLQNGEFQRWRDEPKPRLNVLWCYGIQGSGKVIISD
jgi:hypothetical protein